ncbi:23S rRNA (adenine(2030)-N(6))-methyltransferase RlmJ [Palleronia sp. KMU-117]|uniref:23S rRNA (adenine(2030)-N(6))-methyltransferase RlmJ n=1 Tax=Palleronia sp. KMU-117 TaxID=3434108 RepID=UPI003D75EDAE
MLSYQHIYHAGNPADVQKHALLAAMLAYLAAKDKPLSYIETHAGRGLYRLDAPEAAKTGEAAAGIGRLAGAFPADHPYSLCLAKVRAFYGPSAYPGSPLIAALGLRPSDRIHLCELHPREHAELVRVMAPFRADVRKEDGVAAALSICPPTPRRGLLMIDPSYEVKADYAAIPRFIAAIRRKWNVGIIALWYPILLDGPHKGMVDAILAADPDALRSEVAFPPVREGHRMTGSGMIVLNPPYGLPDEAARIEALFAGL